MVHHSILDRLAKVLGPVKSDDWDKVSQRLILPWILLCKKDKERDSPVDEKQRPDDSTTSVEVHVPQLEEHIKSGREQRIFPPRHLP